MRDADWSRETLLRSDWLGPIVAPITTEVQNRKPKVLGSFPAQNSTWICLSVVTGST